MTENLTISDSEINKITDIVLNKAELTGDVLIDSSIVLNSKLCYLMEI